MGKIKDDEATKIIRDSLAYGKPTRVRVGAMKAIKERGSVLDEEVPLLKDILLHDKEFRVRLHVVTQLIRPLKDRRFLEALREASRRDSQLKIRRKSLEVLYAISEASEQSEAIGRLQAEIDELKEGSRGKPQAGGA
jgi:hypothetical protein